ncbi:M48 family metalloprotease [Tsukamurella soli]|uniref:Zinc metalloprotease HtpX n=1 Tax=Tsukamurella soli TaxID=644556 RepID=A0ABP8KB44_9ACTN
MRATSNRFATAILLGLVPAVLMVVATPFGRIALIVALVGGCGVAAYAYMSSTSLALRAMHARRVSELQQPTLCRIVRELSTVARRPMPAVYLSPTAAPTSFAVGHNQHAAAVCCTMGLLEALDERQLRAVVAHELTHIYERDALCGSVSGALAAVITGLSGFGYLVSGFDGDHDPEHTPRVVSAALAVLGPIAGTIVRLSVSRTCEFHADSAGAILAGDPLALAEALRVLSKRIQAAPLPPDPELVTQAHLMILPPFRRDEKLLRWFRVHPAASTRIARLEAMVGE